MSTWLSAKRKSKQEQDFTPRWSVDLPDYVNSLRFSPDGSMIAAATLAGPVIVLEPGTGTCRYQLAGHTDGALTVAWSPTGVLLATGGHDGMVRLVHAATGHVVAELAGGSAWVEHLAWSRDGQCLASSAGKVVRFFSAEGKSLGEVKDHGSTVTGLVWLPQTELVVTSCYGGLQFLQVGNPQPVKRYEWKGSILSLAVTPDGKYLASGNQDASVHIWRTRSGEDFQMYGYPTKVTTLAFSTNSLTLATGGSKEIALWDFKGKGPAGKKPEVLKGHNGLVTDLAFTQRKGQRRLVSVARDGTLCTWAPQLSPRPITEMKTETPLVRIAIDPQERYLVVANKLGSVSAFPWG